MALEVNTTHQKEIEINRTAVYVTCNRRGHSLFNVVTNDRQIVSSVQSRDLMVANY
jgi:hypothetical protein